MRVLVTGGSDFDERELLFRVLNEQHGRTRFTLLIHGGASGADRLAGEWADANGVDVQVEAPNWKKYGRAAGLIANGEMIRQNPDLVIAFPGGKGTADMVKRADAAGLLVLRVSNRADLE